jgi:hypothetical protein
VLNAVKMESKRLESLTHPETPKTLQQPCNPPPILTSSKTPETLQQPDNPPSSLLPKDKGCKIVFDNFDFQQKVHGMTETHQNPGIHWVTHVAAENRVHESHLSSEKPPNKKLLSMENGSCLPNLHENHLQREKYISLVERVLVELPCLESLKSYKNWSNTYLINTVKKWHRSQKQYVECGFKY